MKIEVNIQKKHFFSLLIIGLVILGVVGVVAYNSAGSSGNPAVMGHSVDEIDWSKVAPGNVSARDGFCIGTDCIRSWSGFTDENGSSITIVAGSGIIVSKVNGVITLSVNESDIVPEQSLISGGDIDFTGVTISASNFIINDLPTNESLPKDLASILCDIDLKYCPPNKVLVNGVHRTTDCAASKGVAVNVSADAWVCQFTAAACPTGWTQYQSWQSSSRKCCHGNTNACSNYDCCTDGHAWGNMGLDSCKYERATFNYGIPSCHNDGTCTSTRTQIGCY